MPEDSPKLTPLPDSLREQLEDFRRQLWRAKIAEAIFAGIFGLLLSYLVVFALDRIWPTPAIVRLGILLAGTSLMAVFAPIWMHRWVWRHRRENQLARLIALKHPHLGDRLLGVIELQQQTESGETLSPRLRAAAMEAVAAEAARRKLDDSLPASRHRRWSLAVVALFLIAGTALTLVPEAGLNSLKRWLFPLSSTPRYTFTLLEGVPQEIAVPQGEAFELNLTLADKSEWQPETGIARYNRQDPVIAGLDERNYRFEFPGQQDPGDVRIEIGDARHNIRIIPSLPPTISRSIAEISYPDYLQLPARSEDLPSGLVSAVQGSKVRLTVEASRRLAEAQFGPVAPADIPGADPILETGDMSLRAQQASTPYIQVDDQSLSVPMVWKDDIGLEGTKTFAIRIEALKDEAPVCYFDGLAGQRAILPEETIDFEVLASDDFGLKEYGLVWDGELTRPGDGEPAKGELRLEQGAPDLGRASTPAAFSPKTLGIGPQKLILRAYAEDYLPNRERSYSQPIVIYVLSREEHAQMLKNQFDRTISELEDLARRERNLFEENQRLDRLDAEEMKEDENRQRLEKQQQAEKEQAENMQELAEKMEELLKDTARNETIDKETLRKMTETMQSMRELGNEDMPKLEQKLGEAGDQKNTEEKSERDMQEAVEQQKELLEKMQETIEKANEANERFEASTFASRLKKAATEQDGVATEAMNGSEHFGLRADQLDPADLGILNDIVRQQSDSTSDVRWIKEDLGHFFTRTDKAVFGEILEEMNKTQVDLGLEEVRLKLSRNHGFSAAEDATTWAKQLREWAEKLEGAKDESGGGGGGGGGGGEDEDFEFMLRVMKMVQKEQDLRSRTRALETLRRSYQTPSKQP